MNGQDLQFAEPTPPRPVPKIDVGEIGDKQLGEWTVRDVAGASVSFDRSMVL
jgi:hypothetical protein